MSKRIDLTVTSTRPDLQVHAQIPGAYIIKDGKQVPDLNDEAMAKREERKLAEKKPVEVKEEKKEVTQGEADETN